MSVLFLFVDGVGLGEEELHNPFIQRTYPGFLEMSGGQPFSGNAAEIVGEEHLFRGVDATLGVEGLPQSGTGQAALFSGENAAAAIGKHFGPFQDSRNREFLQEQSLFRRAAAQGNSCHFINAYPDLFFRRSRESGRWSCTTFMCRSADLSLNGEREVREGRAVTAGLTQMRWKEMLDRSLPVITPEEAADRMLERAEEFDLVLHEYYLTDKAGHGRDPETAAGVLEEYDRFLRHLLAQRNSGDTIVLCSDHGNLEDLSRKTHTRNRVPLFAMGPGAFSFYGAESIMGVTPAILNLLNADPGAP